ncbi:hypothetical protein ACFYXF_03980 [Streptomyces sp. NPDC002680]|uniref:hypothetical protein n=1 Tax=Streptomyces sp. NPDC002680 TaxID=3364659 RepID=UPI0036A23C0E
MLRADSLAGNTAAGHQWPDQRSRDLRELAATWQESAQACTDAASMVRARGQGVLGLPHAEPIPSIAARPPFAGCADPIVPFRAAGTPRQLDRHQAALETIDRKLDLSPPRDASVYADLVRDPSLIAASKDIRELAGRGTAEVRT